MILINRLITKVQKCVMYIFYIYVEMRKLSEWQIVKIEFYT